MQTSERQRINGMIVRVLVEGPTRVVYLDGGELSAGPPAKVKSRFGVTPEIVWIRQDGWSLGAPFSLSSHAYRVWEGQWVAMLNLRTSEVNFITARE